MKVRSIPAQITTVEDKIAGNLSLTQIVLLMVPMFWLMIVYTLFVPSMEFVLYKLPLFLIVGITSLILSLRIKEKIVLHWLMILFRYNLRPKYYLFDKNDSYLRTMDVIDSKNSSRKLPVRASVKALQSVSQPTVSIGDLIRLDGLLTNPKYSFSIKSQKKGALYVAVEQN